MLGYTGQYSFNACFTVYSVSKNSNIWKGETIKIHLSFPKKIIVNIIYFYEKMLKLSSNIDCLQTLPSFSNKSCNSGAFLSIRSIWLANHSHVVNDIIKQVLVLSQYTCFPDAHVCKIKLDISHGLTKQSSGKLPQMKSKMSKIKHFFIIVYKQTGTVHNAHG